MMETKILLVDDEVEFTSILSERLSSRGYKVETANDGIQAINKVSDMNFDAVILDLAMPGLDGIETLEILLNKKPHIQVIFLSGKATWEESFKAVKMGARDVLQKPVDINKLIEKIREVQIEKVMTVNKELEE
jgi:DNA-binding response OmpR family regulator